MGWPGSRSRSSLPATRYRVSMDIWGTKAGSFFLCVVGGRGDRRVQAYATRRPGLDGVP